MTTRPNLIKLADGKWVNPAYITTVSDQRYESGDGLSGQVWISTVGGGFSLDADDPKVNCDAALAALGVK